MGMSLRIGSWRVDPALGEISSEGRTVRLEARAMSLLLRLAERPGQVISVDDLLSHVWSEVVVSPDSVYQAVASLRRELGDDAKHPAYIATVPRLGYRMIATVCPWTEESAAPGPPRADSSDTVELNDCVSSTHEGRVRLQWACGDRGAVCFSGLAA